MPIIDNVVRYSTVPSGLPRVRQIAREIMFFLYIYILISFWQIRKEELGSNLQILREENAHLKREKESCRKENDSMVQKLQSKEVEIGNLKRETGNSKKVISNQENLLETLSHDPFVQQLMVHLSLSLSLPPSPHTHTHVCMYVSIYMCMCMCMCMCMHVCMCAGVLFSLATIPLKLFI